MRGFGKGCAALGLGIFLPSCGIYDAIWGNEANQKRVAAQYAPASLKRGDEAFHTAAAQKLAVRVYATPRYATATLDWQQQFARVVGDANPTLRSDLGVELDVVDYRTWSDGGSESSLPELLNRLEVF